MTHCLFQQVAMMLLASNAVVHLSDRKRQNQGLSKNTRVSSYERLVTWPRISLFLTLNFTVKTNKKR
jgi:hypothetical protein